VLVRGRVQGVFFRASCAEEARRRGVAGFIRNRADGRVEAVFEGPADQVDAMVGWCGTGPPFAQVDSVESRVEEPVGDTGFRVA
jgi:acylphosphatase